MRLDAIQRKNRAYAALANAEQRISQWRQKNYDRRGYAALPPGWAERLAELEAQYRSAVAALAAARMR